MSIAGFDNIYNHPSGYALVWLLICLTFFGILEKLFPYERAQKKLRKDAYIDVIYWVVAPLLYSSIAWVMLVAGFYLLFAGNMDAAWQFLNDGANWANKIPIWLQAIMVLIISDFSLYWTHRLFHHAKLWKFHAVHHGAQQMDFLIAARFHPINIIFHTLVANSICLWIGFSPLSIAVLAPFNTLYSCFVHSNLNLKFDGILKYILVSPIYHRWHHTDPDEGGNMNFAATFPIFDLLFGTYFLPEDKLPGKTGIHEDYVPKTLLGQLIYPFTPEPKSKPKTLDIKRQAPNKYI